MYKKYIKRILDILISLSAIILLWPVYLVLFILVRSKLGSPVLFKQKRPGYKGEIFDMYKFRSMTDERDEKGELLPDEVRLTDFGKKLRSTSRDELPELFNIFIGDMSIVGPRPLLIEYLPWYTEKERHRHDVRPGLTGWAQVNGRNNVDWAARFALDVEYVNSVSLTKDLRIVLLTFLKVIRRSDVTVNTANEGNMAKIRASQREGGHTDL